MIRRSMILLAFAGCGDDLETSPADARQVADASIDGGTIQCDPPAAGAPGSPCSEPEDCDSAAEAGDGRCLNADHRGVIWPETGYCVRICEEAASDCGSGTTCFAQEGAAQVLCMPTCCDGDACADGFACSTTFLGQEVGAAICMPGDPSARFNEKMRLADVR